MMDEVQKIVYIVISIFISIVIHVLLWQLASRFKVASFDSVSVIDNRKLMIWGVDLKDLESIDREPFSALNEDFKKKKSKLLKQIFKEEGIPEKREIKIPHYIKKQLAIDKLNKTGNKLPFLSLSPDILAISAEELSEDRLKMRRRLVPKPVRKSYYKPSIPSFKNITPDYDIDISPSLRLEANDVEHHKLKPQKIFKLGVSKFVTPISIPESNIFENELLISNINKDIYNEEIEILDSVLHIKLRTFEDTKDKEIYYEIVITTKKTAETIPYIPKNVLLLADSSASITFEKLKEFKKGLKLSLDFLNPEDKFNIVAFREKPNPLFSDFSIVSPNNIKKAMDFIDGMKYSGKTDVYAGLAPYVSLSRKQKDRPNIIFLISDGRTTTGFKFENNELIKRIVKKNFSESSIFTFSCGDMTNLFLMDFLSYNNRGVSIHKNRVEKSHLSLVNFVGSLSDVLVSNLKYNITDNLESEVFPKELPHLYRNFPLILYGKMDADIREIAIQVIGRNKNGKKEELIAKLNISDAEAASSELAYQWAVQKIYFLINQGISRYSIDTRKLIRNLSAKYQIKIPYL